MDVCLQAGRGVVKSNQIVAVALMVSVDKSRVALPGAECAAGVAWRPETTATWIEATHMGFIPGVLGGERPSGGTTVSERG